MHKGPVVADRSNNHIVRQRVIARFGRRKCLALQYTSRCTRSLVKQQAKPDSLFIKLIMNATTTPFPEYDRLKLVAEHCAELQEEWLTEEEYRVPYTIPGIPVWLWPVDEAASLIELLDVHKEILENARKEDSMALLEYRELIPLLHRERMSNERVAERARKFLDEIHHTLVYQSIHLQIQLNVFQRDNAGQIYFPGTRIHDIPPVNIRFRVDPNWSTVEFRQKNNDFYHEYTRYSLMIDAYKFTHNASRIANAIRLSSREDHPFDPFFLAPRYIQLFRVDLIEEIAIWLHHNHQHWSVISP